MKQNEKKHQDTRSIRSVMVRDKSTNKTITLQQNDSVVISGCKVSFCTPNNVSIFVSISKRELNISKNLYKNLFIEKIKNKKNITLENKDLSKLYTYLEHIQSCIICVYTAIEALANIAIPNDYKYETKNSKGISETWNKETIERWFNTSNKFTRILPSILKFDNPSSQPFWSKFKELEVIRNEIIHQKTSAKKSTDVDSNYLTILIQPKIFDNIQAAYDLISYICNADISHPFFPLGFGPATINITEVDNFEDFFELVKEENT